MKALIDGDVILHKTLAIYTEKTYVPIVLPDYYKAYDTVTELREEHPDCEYTTYEWPMLSVDKLHEKFKESIDRLIDYSEAKDYRVLLSNRDKDKNHRYNIAKQQPYKGKRKPKPEQFEALYELVAADSKTFIAPNGEADDWLGLMQNEDTCIMTSDKDLLQVMGQHFVLQNSEENKPKHYEVLDYLGKLWKEGNKTRGTGFKFFCYQVLVGDTSDNYGGLYRFGDAKAFPLLENVNHEQACWEAVKAAYADKKADYLEEMARLAWIWKKTSLTSKLTYQDPVFSDGKGLTYG